MESNINWIVLTLIFTTILGRSRAVPAQATGNFSVPAIFVFGDSTADVGTNNYLPECLAKANMPRHGIDFPGSKPTGRFSNGYNSIDFLSRYLGFKESPPPYLYLRKNERRSFMRDILKGVNFASGGAGILENTGRRPYKRVVPLSDQLQQFAYVRNSLVKVLGSTDKAAERISKSLFIISVGSNDIFEHVLFDKVPAKGDRFIANLLVAYEKQLKSLIRMGAKRLGLMGVAPLGCVPVMRVPSATDECNPVMNDYAKQFNAGLQALLKKLSSQGVKPMKYSLAMPYDMTYKIIKNPTSYGFKDGKSACCGNGKRLNAEQPCKPDSKVCGDRDKNLFWDQFHPSQAANELLALSIYEGDYTKTAPLNINQLATLKF